MACSLAFHAITLERSSFMKITFFKIKPVYNIALNPLLSLFAQFLARGGKKHGNGQRRTETDRQTHLRTTVYTLAAHARRGLIRVQYELVMERPV